MPGQRTISAFAEIRHLEVDEAEARAHVMRPQHVRGIVSLTPGAAGPRFGAATPGLDEHRLDVEAFGDGVHAALAGRVAGYLMRLQQHGQTILARSFNWAKTPADGSDPWAPATRMHVASCSKLITAIAMTRLLRDKGLSVDTPVGPFLPDYWAKGPNVEKITFRHLMTHTSGFDTGTSRSDFEVMKGTVAAGVSEVPATFAYQNMNFGLCRILVATVSGALSPATVFEIPSMTNDSLWDVTTINVYARYVRDSVFGPAGVFGPTLDHPPEDALAYPFPAGGNGWNSNDLRTMSGGAGWHMSADDLLGVMSAVRRRGSIISAEDADAMLQARLGVDDFTTMFTPFGMYYGKSGYWENLDGAGVRRAEQSLVCFLPLDMELAVLVNSPLGHPARSFPDAVAQAYLDSIRSLRLFLQRRGLPTTSSIHALAGPSRSVRAMLGA
jgi:CubicO group peptidase (beta-lactamase class C family)